MSGGSYNYLYNQRDVRGYIDLGDLESMRDRLRELAPGSAATTATERLYDAPTAPLDAGLTDVWHAVEWYDSADYGLDQAEQAIREYGEKHERTVS